MNSDQLSKPEKPTCEEIEADLSLIEINERDVLFERQSSSTNEINNSNKELEYKRLEKYILFKLNLESDNQKEDSNLSIESVSKDLDFIDKHIHSLKNFIDISKKFLSINPINK